MALIEIKDLYKRFKQGSKTINAVDGIDLTVNEGDFWAIVGPSGSGKSTLLQLIGALDRPTSGQVIIDGKDITKQSDRQLAHLRQQSLGFVFQNFNLIPTLTAAQNVEAAIAKRGRDDKKRVLELLGQVGLADRAHHLPSLLSGGEQQRVALVRALVNHPRIILADEPTGNLDSKSGEEIMKILIDLNKKHAQTIILITHSDYVRQYAQHVGEMHDGKLTV
ncbi:MAG TPA: ABC transporter ATP-binding protein [bacterium]|nr:ABC transporter ATP-binding protein [bacterium]